MTTDLSRFRGTGAGSGTEREYQALKEDGSLQRRCAFIGGPDAGITIPSYAYLQNVTTDNVSMIGLYYAFSLIVEIRGRHLNKLVNALCNEKAEIVQVYDATKWPEPAPGTLVVTEILFHNSRREDPSPQPATTKATSH